MIKTVLRYLGVSDILRTGSIMATLNGLSITTNLKTIVSVDSSTPGPATDDLLLESGSFRLLENGDKLLLG